MWEIPRSEPISKQTKEITSTEEVLANPKEGRDSLRESIRREKRLMASIGYLTTPQQLADHSELDNLFDGQVVLGEEELLATYSLIDILNGNASFSTLKPPVRLSYERNFALDSSYEIGYENMTNPKTGKKEAFLSSIHWTTNLIPSSLIDTNLKFHYNQKTGLVESAVFERPSLAFNENIKIHRNIAGLVDKIEVGNMAKVDNTITIEYEDGRPFSMKQTKYGALDDTTFFSYDDQWNLDAIIYAPAISVKAIKGMAKGKNLQGVAKSVARTMLGTLKRSKGVDTVEIENVDGVPVSTKALLNASNWWYTDGKSKFEWNWGQLRTMHLEMQHVPIDDKKDIKFEY